MARPSIITGVKVFVCLLMGAVCGFVFSSEFGLPVAVGIGSVVAVILIVISTALVPELRTDLNGVSINYVFPFRQSRTLSWEEIETIDIAKKADWGAGTFIVIILLRNGDKIRARFFAFDTAVVEKILLVLQRRSSG